MIEKLEETIQDYEVELQDLSDDELEIKENDSFTINGNRLSQIPGIVNEKIKITDTFTHYIIERCNPSHVNILRRFVEDYERQVELLKSRMLGSEEVEQLKMVTVAIDLLFGIDVSYYTVLSRMFSESKIDRIYNYFNENINYNLSYNELCTAIKRKGYGK